MKYIFTIFIFCIISISTYCQTFSIVSWNISHFGKTKDASEIHQIAQLIRDFDIVAIQEVVAVDPAGAKAVTRLADELNRMGARWDYRVSDPTNSSSGKKERYAFLWKSKKIKLKGRLWLDKTFDDIIIREPYLARFQIEEEEILLVNYHSRVHKEKPEKEIVCFYEYPKMFPDEQIIIAGDFNKYVSDDVFLPLRELGFQPNLENQKTTLKRKCGEKGEYLNHPIDYILVDTDEMKIEKVGVVDFVRDCKKLKEARRLSDHLPVWVEISF